VLRTLTILALLALILAACGGPARVRLGAASSLSEVLPAALGDAEIEVIYGGSGELAAQLRHGAPFDALLLADPAPLARAASLGLVTPPKGAFANTLVLASRAPPSDEGPATPTELIRHAGCLAIGAPGVPAGDYGRRWLATLDLDLPDLRLIELPHVRAVVAAVESGACPLGMVYATDLRGRSLHTASTWAPRGEVGPVYAWAVAPGSPRAAAASAILEAALAKSDLFEAHGFHGITIR